MRGDPFTAGGVGNGEEMDCQAFADGRTRGCEPAALQVATHLACLKIERGPSARLLALARVGSAHWLAKPLPVSAEG